MKLRILSLLTLIALLLTGIVACASPDKDLNDDSSQESTPNDESNDESEDESQAEETPDKINIYTLNGTTGFGMAKLMNDKKDGYVFSVKTEASDVTSALINGSVDIAALPTNAAANVYNKTNGGVKILAVNTLGCLYLLTKDGVSVSNFEDLRGKTVYVPAQNPTFIFTELCKKNNLTPGTDITIDSTSYAAPVNLREAVAGGKVEIAVLPEPMVTMAISAAKNNQHTYQNAMDLTAEWDKVHTPGSLVQGCVVVRSEFLEKYPTAVAQFLTDYEASIEFLTENTAEAAQMIAENGIFANATVAEKAIPKCNVCFLDGAEMKSAMEIYLNVLYGINPNSIGGKLPEASFYYNAE